MCKHIVNKGSNFIHSYLNSFSNSFSLCIVEIEIGCFVPLLLCCMAIKCAMRNYVNWSSLSHKTVHWWWLWKILVKYGMYKSVGHNSRTASLLQIPIFILIPNVNTYKWFPYNSLCGDRLTFRSQDLPPKQLNTLSFFDTTDYPQHSLSFIVCVIDFFIVRVDLFVPYQ